MKKKPAKTRLAADERRARLVAMGIELFNRRPYDAISIDEIAEEAGMAKGLLYHYFKTKRHFYRATVEAAAIQFGEVMGAACLDAGTPDERLSASIDAYLDYVENHALGYSHLMTSGVGADPEIAALVEVQRQVLIERILDGSGVVPPTPLLKLAVRAWIGLVEAASLEWLRNRQVTRAQLEHMFTATLQTIADLATPAVPIARPER